MKKKLIATILLAVTVLSGCSNPLDNIIVNEEETTYDGVVSETTATDGIYVLKEDGTLYELNTVGQNYSGTTTSADSKRLCWYTNDSKVIPTLSSGDELIIYSQSELENEYSIEQFEDAGYSFGISGITIADDGYAQADFGSDYLASSSLYIQLMQNFNSGVVNIATINGNSVTKDYLSSAGTFYNLEKGKAYTLECYQGTYYASLDVTADTRVFISINTDVITDIEYTKENYAIFHMPSYAESGYYNINGAGMFYYEK